MRAPRMRTLVAPLLALALIAGAGGPARALEPRAFESPVQEARYRELLAELRCLVCQNQSLADSNADLARDLRAEVYERVRAGQSNEAIVDYLVARYGDFVRYRPPVEPRTWLLWFGPLALGAGGVAVLLVYLHRRRRGAVWTDPGLGDDERARIAMLLREAEQDRGPR